MKMPFYHIYNPYNCIREQNRHKNCRHNKQETLQIWHTTASLCHQIDILKQSSVLSVLRLPHSPITVCSAPAPPLSAFELPYAHRSSVVVGIIYWDFFFPCLWLDLWLVTWFLCVLCKATTINYLHPAQSLYVLSLQVGAWASILWVTS